MLLNINHICIYHSLERQPYTKHMHNHIQHLSRVCGLQRRRDTRAVYSNYNEQQAVLSVLLQQAVLSLLLQQAVLSMLLQQAVLSVLLQQSVLSVLLQQAVLSVLLQQAVLSVCCNKQSSAYCCIHRDCNIELHYIEYGLK